MRGKMLSMGCLTSLTKKILITSFSDKLEHHSAKFLEVFWTIEKADSKRQKVFIFIILNYFMTFFGTTRRLWKVTRVKNATFSKNFQNLCFSRNLLENSNQSRKNQILKNLFNWFWNIFSGGFNWHFIEVRVSCCCFSLLLRTNDNSFCCQWAHSLQQHFVDRVNVKCRASLRKRTTGFVNDPGMQTKKFSKKVFHPGKFPEIFMIIRHRFFMKKPSKIFRVCLSYIYRKVISQTLFHGKIWMVNIGYSSVVSNFADIKKNAGENAQFRIRI